MISDSDKYLLNHVYRYRITTPEAVRCLFYADGTLDDVREAYRRLRKENYLAQGFLWRGQPYYCLGPAAAALFPNARVGTLAEQDVASAFAMLAFCHYGGDVARKAITLEELRAFVPQLVIKQLGNDRYYMDTNGDEHRLGFIKVDRGFNYRRSNHQLTNLLRKRARFAAWSQLIEQRRLVVTFATAWEEKAKLIQTTLDSRPQAVSYGVFVLADLRHFVASTPTER